MLTLDDEDYELLGWGSSRIVEEYARQQSLVQKRRLMRNRERYRDDPAYRQMRRAYSKKYGNTEAKKQATARYKQTDKGKAMKARSWKKYYEKNKARIVARVDAWRKAKKGKTP